MLESAVRVHAAVSRMRRPEQEVGHSLHSIRCPGEDVADGGAAGLGRDSSRRDRGVAAPSGAAAIEFGERGIHNDHVVVAGAGAQVSAVTSAACRAAAARPEASPIAIAASEAGREAADAAAQ